MIRYLKPRSNIKLEACSSELQTPTGDLSNAKGVSNDIQTLESYISNTERSFFTSDIKTRKRNIQNTRECVKLYT